MYEQLISQISQGDQKALARGISFIENEQQGYEKILQSLKVNAANVIGLTGPPGAGKSTIVDAMIGEMVKENKTVAVLCVDPSSPFNLGALLGDRIRMSEWYSHPKVFIRSLASRGSVGGLAPKIIEITDLIKSSGVDYIIIETVGVGQSEIEIAGLADVTIVVLTPLSGDEVQTMKSDLMEIADVFAINKADRPDAELLEKNLRMMLAPIPGRNTVVPPVIKTIATEKKGIDKLIEAVYNSFNVEGNNDKRLTLLTEKAWQLLTAKRMKDLDKWEIRNRIKANYRTPGFNLFSFINEI